MPVPIPENPCLHCGACCAFYQVSFYWDEAEPALGGKVPQELAEELTDFRRCMKGTNQKQPRCIALEGEIGKTVRCAIYGRRPITCRKFGILYRSGVLRVSAEELELCNRARAGWNLPPLFNFWFDSRLTLAYPSLLPEDHLL
jgi:Fe-S-cluster containining protein